MLNSIFAGILAQYGMGEAQIQNAEGQAQVDNAEPMVETAEGQAQVQNAEPQVEVEIENLARKSVNWALLSVYGVPYEVYEGVDNGEIDDPVDWINKNEDKVAELSLEVVLFAEDDFMPIQVGRMLRYEAADTKTRLGYLTGSCFYVADIDELTNGVSAYALNYAPSSYELKRNVIKTMINEHKRGFSKWFIG